METPIGKHSCCWDKIGADDADDEALRAFGDGDDDDDDDDEVNMPTSAESMQQRHSQIASLGNKGAELGAPVGCEAASLTEQ